MTIQIACSEKEYPVQQGSIERDGYQIAYSIQGQGQPIVIVGSVVYYQRVFSQNLRNNAQLIFIDHRGFTPCVNAIDPQAITIDTLVEDLEYIRVQLGLEKFVIMGHSGHGLLVLEYAKKYENIVESVVIIGISPDLSKESLVLADQYFQDSACAQRKLIDEQHRLILPERIAAHPDKKFIMTLIGLAARSWYDYNFDPASLWDGVYANMPVIDRVWGQLFAEIDITQGLQDFRKPVLLMLGKFDYLVAPSYLWNSILPQFNDITLQIFERSCHTPPFEEPELFDNQLLDWIDNHCR